MQKAMLIQRQHSNVLVVGRPVTSMLTVVQFIPDLEDHSDKVIAKNMSILLLPVVIVHLLLYGCETWSLTLWEGQTERHR
jgi:hypothetical protein